MQKIKKNYKLLINKIEKFNNAISEEYIIFINQCKVF